MGGFYDSCFWQDRAWRVYFCLSEEDRGVKQNGKSDFEDTSTSHPMADVQMASSHRKQTPKCMFWKLQFRHEVNNIQKDLRSMKNIGQTHVANW